MLHAALASEAAAAQGKFWPMHDLLFDNQRHLKLPQLRGYAERLALDMARYDTEMTDTVHLQRVREDIRGGSASGVRATPTFFVNGVLQDASYGPSRYSTGWRRNSAPDSKMPVGDKQKGGCSQAELPSPAPRRVLQNAASFCLLRLACAVECQAQVAGVCARFDQVGIKRHSTGQYARNR